MGLRADRKKARRQFKVGDLVTWGNEVSTHPIVEVHADGVTVNGGADFPRLFVSWEGAGRGRGPGLQPLRKA